MEHSFPFNSVNGDRKYYDEDFARYFKPILTNGVFPNPSNTLQVTADGSSMKISVQPGNGWINGRGYNNDAAWYYQLTNADGATNRTDRIVLRWSRADRSITLAVKQGAYATTPVSPALQRDDDIYELALADVYVGAGVTSITQAVITDLRLNNDLCGLVCSIFTPDTAHYYDQIQADLANFRSSNEAGFTEWVNGLKNALSGDVAGNLQNEIDQKADKTGTLKSPNALTVTQGYGGDTGPYDGSTAKTVSIPHVTLNTASPIATLADGELYGVY